MKKVLLAMFALLLMAGIYSFTTHAKSVKKETLKWFEYIDIPGNNPNNPAHYQLTAGGGTTDPGCTGSTKVCAVYAEPSGSNPDIPNLDEVDQTERKD